MSTDRMILAYLGTAPATLHTAETLSAVMNVSVRTVRLRFHALARARKVVLDSMNHRARLPADGEQGGYLMHDGSVRAAL